VAEPLLRALARVRGMLLDDAALVRAVGSGRQKGATPRWRRVELRYVDLKSGRRLQVTSYDDKQAHIANHEPGPDARDAVDALLDEPFGNWHVETTTETHQLRVTKKGQALLHTSARSTGADAEDASEPQRTHDRRKPRLLPEDDPALVVTGISDEHGSVKPSRQAKYRQVEEFLRILAGQMNDALQSGKLRQPTEDQPLRVVDLGCGNAYLTFAAHGYLTRVMKLPVRMVGVDNNAELAARNNERADRIGAGDTLTFLPGDIASTELDLPPDVVLALHACDTATDDALARAVEWGASLVLAAPCCHHDVAAQLRRAPTPAPYAELTRHGILRERLADTLTDAFRASLMRQSGYRVDVVQFVESQHTPRNTLLRAVRTGAAPSEQVLREFDDLTRTWGVHPRLAELLRDRVG
jgi:SAM-dependent methyltransferase